MNGTKSPDQSTAEAGDSGRDEIVVRPNSSHHNDDTNAAGRTGSDDNPDEPPGKDPEQPQDTAAVNGVDDNASEAETLIDSPVKKKQLAEKQMEHGVKVERKMSRIGGLPVPLTDEEDTSAAVSPAASTLISVEKDTSTADATVNADQDAAVEDDEGSESLSSPGSSGSEADSRGSSVERAASEVPGQSRNEDHSPNTRKRKHRASSVSLPNKRPSLDAPKIRRRGPHSEDTPGRSEQSLSPELRTHRRAASTQSAFADGGLDSNSRKRRYNTQQPRKESKTSRATWEESDASSEATSHGHLDFRRPQRGIGRSTSTPGRPAGREHKRHVNKYGFTRLAEACEDGDLDLVKEWRKKDPEQLELAEFAGNKPLQIAALNGNVEVVDYLIDQGCQIDCANVDKDTPLIDAAENGHVDVVHSLLKAGVDPLRQNLKGQQALDVVTDDTDNVAGIRAALRKAIDEWNSNGAKQKREEEEENRHRAGPSKELHFMARSYENLLKLVQNNDRNGVKEFLDARVPVDNTIIAAAAKTGDNYLVNMLLAEMSDKKAAQKPERPMLSVLGTSHFDMVRSLTELENFNPLFRNRQGKTWPDIANERHGPNWRQELELLQRLYDQRAALKERRSSSPVTKRDSNQRRFAQATADDESDDSDEAEAPRRKNGGRRLMSKKAMRANGRGNSDSSSADESDSELANTKSPLEDGAMGPPESPGLTRTSTRSRTKSVSIPAPESSPRTRRRSLSFRGTADKPLPTVDETAEEKQAADERKAAEKKAEEEAERLGTIRKAEEAAAAERAAKEAAEEQARKAEEERKADEARRAEETRKAEEARKAEEDRIHSEREKAEAKRAHEDEVLASLPVMVSNVLRPSSDPTRPTDLSLILKHFTPLRVVQHESDDMDMDMDQKGIDSSSWVLNVQSAPFLGPRGLELMLQSAGAGYEGSLAEQWTTKDLASNEMDAVVSVLSYLAQDSSGELPPAPVDQDGMSMLTWEEELQRAQDHENARLATKRRLREGKAKLRYVRLGDVMRHLCPAAKKALLPVHFDRLRGKRQHGKYHDDSFVRALSNGIKQISGPRAYMNGEMVDIETTSWTGVTNCRTVHQK
ncbi:ankyrin like protein [Zymoseptoria brevis]|uniref:Ankyrin like protein n=1 Tax=Zymoseptoria brevis TaxID=1047168 RepID=A0A0F4GDF5_9PEZI|nr:ankyrin like protein [Zymoseptoria brevis]